MVSISSKNNDHLQRNSNNCLNSVLCVSAHESVIKARKLSDEDIHKLALTEGRTMGLIKQSLIHGFTSNNISVIQHFVLKN